MRGSQPPSTKVEGLRVQGFKGPRIEVTGSQLLADQDL